MASKREARFAMTLGAALLALAIVLLANLLADRRFARVDLTAEGRYSLSEPFLNILAKIDPRSPVKLTYFVSGTVPTYFAQERRDILDRLREIETAGRGLVRLEILDPDRNPAIRRELEEQQLKLQVREVERDRVSFTSLFSTLQLTYQDKPMVIIPRIEQAEQLEFELASRILELTLDRKPIIALHAPKPAQNQGPRMISGFEWILASEYERRKFDVRTIDLASGEQAIPAGTRLLLLISPGGLEERARYEISRFLAQGGRVFLIANGFRISNQFGFKAEQTPSGLEPELDALGISFGNHFICDVNNVKLATNVNPATNEVTYQPLPFYVKIDANLVDQESPITKFLPYLVLPFPGELYLDRDRLRKLGLETAILATTSPESWTTPFQELYEPEKFRPTQRSPEGRKPVFVKIEGQFPCPWEGKPPPPWKTEEGQEGAKRQAQAQPLQKAPGMLLLWTSPESFQSRFFTEAIKQEFLGNQAILSNVAEAMTLGNDLIRIRSKSYETRALAPLHDSRRNLVKILLIAGVPFLVICFALLRWLLRRGQQVSYERTFAQTIGPSSFNP